MGVIDWEDAMPFMKLFDKLCKESGNKTGTLTKEDLAYAEKVQEPLSGRLRGLTVDSHARRSFSVSYGRSSHARENAARETLGLRPKVRHDVEISGFSGQPAAGSGPSGSTHSEPGSWFSRPPTRGARRAKVAAPEAQERAKAVMLHSSQI